MSKDTDWILKGKILKQSKFSQKKSSRKIPKSQHCLKGQLTLREDEYEAICYDSEHEWEYTQKLEGIERFKIIRGSPRRLQIDEAVYTVKDPVEWIEAIKGALDAKGMKYYVTEYRVAS